jgi:hypothetical protein
VALCAGLTPAARANIPAYTLVGSFQMPGGNIWAGGAYDLLPDGRIVRIQGTSIFIQDTLHGSTQSLVGTIPTGTVSAFGASFIRVSPDGSMLAIGDNTFGPSARVHIARVSDLSLSGPAPTQSILSPNFDAAWSGNSTLYVSGFGSSSLLSRIDLSGAGPTASTTVITGIGDGSGGVAVFGGTLYTGIGFAFPPASPQARTGSTRAFDLASLESAASPVAFSSGTYLGDFLSASPMAVDPFGNLLIGGGDVFSGTSDSGYIAVVDPSNPSSPLLLSPPGSAGLALGVRFNAATQELWIDRDGTIFRYAIPSPGIACALAMGTLLAWRRRRA